ncbi:MAG: IS1380 family transposase [Marinovum sp.]|nr:IS1380 family transposase [Marinovum sp.]
MDHPTGAGSNGDIRVDFDARVRLEFHGSKISSDGGLLLYRELDEALGLFNKTVQSLRDTRKGKNGVHTLLGLLRQSVFGRLAGYEDVNDAARLARDPVMRQIIGGRAVDGQAASSSQMGRFETEVLATAANRGALADMPGQWIEAIHDAQPTKWITLDMDSSVSPTHGAQEGTAWNGHFGCNCYHPLFIFNQFGHLERCALRNGNVHSADDWKEILAPVIARYKTRDLMRFFRADAAFAIPELYETLEAEGYHYAIRLKKNTVLEEKISHRLTRPVGRPSKTKIKRFYETFEYQAASWSKPRQVVAKIEWHPGDLFPRVGFVVTNLPMEPDWIIRFYNQRGTAEQHIKEGKYAINWTRLSCKRFRHNEVRLQLHALAYNLGSFLQRADLPEEVAGWSLTSIQSRLIKIGARVVRHARKITFQLAEVAVSGPLFGQIITAIRNIKPPPRPA